MTQITSPEVFRSVVQSSRRSIYLHMHIVVMCHHPGNAILQDSRSARSMSRRNDTTNGSRSVNSGAGVRWVSMGSAMNTVHIRSAQGALQLTNQIISKAVSKTGGEKPLVSKHYTEKHKHR